VQVVNAMPRAKPAKRRKPNAGDDKAHGTSQIAE